MSFVCFACDSRVVSIWKSYEIHLSLIFVSHNCFMVRSRPSWRPGEEWGPTTPWTFHGAPQENIGMLGSHGICFPCSDVLLYTPFICLSSNCQMVFRCLSYAFPIISYACLWVVHVCCVCAFVFCSLVSFSSVFEILVFYFCLFICFSSDYHVVCSHGFQMITLRRSHDLRVFILFPHHVFTSFSHAFVYHCVHMVSV